MADTCRRARGLDMLRSRKARSEEPLGPRVPEPIVSPRSGSTPVGLALLIVLETLSPAERLAFVVHDMVGVPFDEIAPNVERSPEATRRLASRARRRVQARGGPPAADRSAAWARHGELGELAVRAPEPGRLTLGRSGRRGRLLATPPDTHPALIAPTRSGKTSRGIIPWLLEHQRPAVVPSKPDVRQATLTKRRRLGRVWLFDPSALSPQPGHRSRAPRSRTGRL